MLTAHALRPLPIAPWAEMVPTPGPVTVDILLTLPDDGHVYEVVEGMLVRMAGSGNRATRLAARLTARLLDYIEARGLGAVTAADGVYKFPGAETCLIPDVGYYGAAKMVLIEETINLSPSRRIWRSRWRPLRRMRRIWLPRRAST